MKKGVLLFVVLTALAFSANAQFGGLLDKAKKKAEEKAKEKAQEKKENAEKKAESKVDNTIDKSIDNPKSVTSSGGTSVSNAEYKGQTPDKDGFIKDGKEMLWNPKTRFFRLPSKMTTTGYLYNPERGYFGWWPHEGVTSDYHQKNLGKVIFTGGLISNDNPQGKEKTTFNATDSVYFTMFLQRTLCSYMLKSGYLYDTIPNTYKIDNNKSKWFSVWASVDGGKYERVFDDEFGADNPEKTKNSFAVCKGLIEGIQQPHKGWKEWVETMPAGTHQVNLQVWGGDGGGNGKNNEFPKKGNWSTDSVVASGAFTMIKKDGEKFPDINAHLQKYYYKVELDNSWKEFKDSRVKDNGITNAFHKENVGKVLFSKKKLSEAELNAANSYAPSFTGSDKIYFSFFMDTSLYNRPLRLVDTVNIKYDSRDVGVYLKHYNDALKFTKEQTFSLAKLRPYDNNHQEFFINITIDGKKLSDIPEIAKASHAWESTITGSLRDTTLRAKTIVSSGYNYMSDNNDANKLDSWPVIANALAPGEHRVQFEVYSGGDKYRTQKPVAVGSFIYTKVAGFMVPYGYSLADYWDKAYMAGSGTEAEFKAHINAVLTKEGSKLVKFSITSNDWIVDRNALDIIKGKFINVQFLYKDKEGYYNYNTNNFYKEYTGAGGYSKTRGPDEIGSGTVINPSTMK